MRRVIYKSKKLGDVLIRNESNQYSIFSSKVEARSLNQEGEDDLIEKYTRLLGNQENVRLFGTGKAWTPEEVRGFIKNELKEWNSDNKFSVFSIYHSSTQEFIGFLQVRHALDDFSHVGEGHSNVGEIAYIIDKDFWGNGYGTELAILGKKFIKYIISESEQTLERDIKEIVATVHPENEGSKRILQKTLKHQEPEEFAKFGGQPRLLFFKPLISSMVVPEQAERTNFLISKL
ncbi:GNAT family N-acetyltransferase [Legionella rowbothamii]|uniref:GNAT family N-acetyltransferase n=1 Tax=Legionella rowbothamii TaxID=96229 RepID=UPI0010544446|nr:GNAT family N-acetyltransferase [Legionella rowbothamii]